MYIEVYRKWLYALLIMIMLLSIDQVVLFGQETQFVSLDEKLGNVGKKLGNVFDGKLKNKDKAEIISIINERNDIEDSGEHRILVVPLLYRYASIANLSSENLINKILSKNIKNTRIDYILEEVGSKDLFLKGIDKYKPKENYSMLIVLNVLDDITSSDENYDIEVLVFNARNEIPVYEAKYEVDLNSILDTTIENEDEITVVNHISKLISERAVTNDIYSLIYLSNRSNARLPQKYKVTMDGEEINTISLRDGIFYFPTGRHIFDVYQSVDGIDRKVETFITNAHNLKYSVSVQFVKKEFNFSIPLIFDLMLGYQIPYVIGADTNSFGILEGTPLISLQTKYELEKHIPIPLYVGVDVLYAPLDQLNSVAYNELGEEYNEDAIRQSISILLDVGYTSTINININGNKDLLWSAGVLGGAHLISLPYGQEGFYYSSLPVFGAKIRSIQKLSTQFHVSEQITFLASDLSWAYSQSLSPTEDTKNFVLVDSGNTFYSLLGISVGAGFKF